MFNLLLLYPLWHTVSLVSFFFSKSSKIIILTQNFHFHFGLAVVKATRVMVSSAGAVNIMHGASNFSVLKPDSAREIFAETNIVTAGEGSNACFWESTTNTASEHSGEVLWQSGYVDRTHTLESLSQDINDRRLWGRL